MEIDIENPRYPEQLKNIKNPPKKIYAKGNIELLKTKRNINNWFKNTIKIWQKMTKKFATELSQYGLTIISGMAEGIDGIAHSATLEVYGKTIAVLPCGFKNIFPENNIKLYEQILENDGLVISEYEENEKAEYNYFLERNRIVAGLSIGTLVVEGGYRSGTSVTARLAKEQEKNVFCIPSSLENSKGITPNKLIQEGAFLVTNVEDIIKNYPELDLIKVEVQKEKNVEPEFKEIYDILNYDEPIHINEIAKKLNLSISEINAKLMMLELEEKIVSLPGNNYKKC